MISVGQIVFAKNGRDKGLAFIVTAIEGDYVFIVNGKNRTLEKPKKKKQKHIQISYYVDEEIGKTLVNNGYLLDASIRSALARYNDTNTVRR